MNPFEYDTRNFPRRMTFRRWVHEHRWAGRIFAMIGLVLVLPAHAIAGAVEQIRDGGLNEFRLLLRMAFSRWVNRAEATRAKGLSQ